MGLLVIQIVSSLAEHASSTHLSALLIFGIYLADNQTLIPRAVFIEHLFERTFHLIFESGLLAERPRKFGWS